MEPKLKEISLISLHASRAIPATLTIPLATYLVLAPLHEQPFLLPKDQPHIEQGSTTRTNTGTGIYWSVQSTASSAATSSGFDLKGFNVKYYLR